MNEVNSGGRRIVSDSPPKAPPNAADDFTDSATAVLLSTATAQRAAPPLTPGAPTQSHAGCALSQWPNTAVLSDIDRERNHLVDGVFDIASDSSGRSPYSVHSQAIAALTFVFMFTVTVTEPLRRFAARDADPTTREGLTVAGSR
ncbi:MAG: hypothetical protein ACRDSS_09235 [Actinocrinis sp.]